ncbi:MAG: helix-turn-helix transcriptional regulator [Liquorilactobacillus mali]|uniref:XRE family transcriptional regulator n=1 Tax=Liquorilactobacillus mali TaxID=1618 RepID=UPI0039EC5E57
MLENLEKAREIKKVSLVDIADLIHVRYQTVAAKINGDSDFKFGEAVKIQERFFPEYDVKFLFDQHYEELQPA